MHDHASSSVYKVTTLKLKSVSTFGAFALCLPFTQEATLQAFNLFSSGSHCVFPNG